MTQATGLNVQEIEPQTGESIIFLSNFQFHLLPKRKWSNIWAPIFHKTSSCHQVRNCVPHFKMNIKKVRTR